MKAEEFQHFDGLGLAEIVRRREVSPEELEKRSARYVPPTPNVTRGYLKFYSDHVGPAHEGATLPR